MPRSARRADFQVRSDVAIRRHQMLVTCAFSGAARNLRLAYPWIGLQRWWTAGPKAAYAPQLQALNTLLGRRLRPLYPDLTNLR